MRSHILRVTVDYLTLTARNCRESLIIYRYEFISTSAVHHQRWGIQVPNIIIIIIVHIIIMTTLLWMGK